MRDHNASRDRRTQNPHPGSPENPTSNDTAHRSSRFDQAILDALPAHIALVDASGCIIAVNRKWVEFGSANGCGGGATVGDNYFSASEHAKTSGDEHAHAAVDGIRAVLNGESESFSLEYPCHSENEQRWFRMDAAPCGDGSEPLAVVMHTNITDEKGRSEEQHLTLANLAERVKELDVLHKTAELLKLDPEPDEHLLKKIVDLLPSALRFPELAAARIKIGSTEIRHEKFPQARPRASTTFDDEFIGTGLLEVAYFADSPELENDPFLPEEHQMLASVAEILRSYLLRKHAAGHIKRGQDRLQKQNDALRELTRANIWQDEDASLSLRKVTETVSAAMEVDRVSIWWLSDDDSAIVAADLYESSEDRHSSGLTLTESDFPAYFAAVRESEVIAADDAVTDTRTREFAESYLEPQRISSMLDAPVIVHGTLRGVVCCEHVGDRREWTLAERSFVVSIASLVSMMVAQRERSESERWVRTTMDSVVDGIHTLDADGNIVDENAAAMAMLGFSPAELIGKHSHHTIHHHRVDGSEYPIEECPIFQTLKDGIPRSVEHEVFFRRDGSPIPVSYSVSPISSSGGPIGGAVISFRDITKELEADAALKRSEAVAKFASRASSLGAWEVRLPEMQVIWTDETRAIFEIAPDEMPSVEEGLSLYTPQTRGMVEYLFRQCVVEGAPFDIEAGITTRKGNSRWVRVIGEAVRDANGEITGARGAIQDITHLKTAEQEMAAIAHRLNTTLESMTEAFVILDHDWNVTYWNREAENVIGLKREEILNKNLWNVFPDALNSKFFSEYKRAIAEQVPVAFDEYLLPLDLWLEVRAYPTEEGLAIYFHDITDERAADEALKESEERFRNVVENTPQAVFIEVDGKFAYANPAALALYGARNPEELIGQPIIDRCHPDFRKIVGERIRFLTEESQALPMIEQALVTLSGDVRYANVSPMPFVYQGQPGALVFATDVTERKKADQALRESDEKFKQLAENINDVFWIRSADMQQVLYISPGFERIWGRQIGDNTERPERWQDFVFPDDRDWVAEAFRRLVDVEDQIDVEYRIVRPDGGIRWIRSRGFAVKDPATGERIRIAGIVTDITEKKQVEEQMLASEQRYRTLFISNPLPMFVYDCETYKILDANDAAVASYGYTLNEFRKMDLVGIHRDEDREILLSTIKNVTGPIRKPGIWRHVRKDGSLIDVEVTTHDVNFDGRRARLELANDVTDRIRAQKGMYESEERFRLLAKATNDAIWDWDLKSDTLWWNEGFESITGFARSDIETSIEWWGNNIHPADSARIVAEVKDAIKSGKESWSGEYRFGKRDGSYAFVLDRGYVIRDDDGTPVRMVGGMTDLTERRSLEEQLRQSQKMEAIGQLAGGIAHDFNNLLTVINGYSEMLLRREFGDDRARSALTGIHEAGKRAESLTRQLLAFSRRQPLNPTVVDLNGLLGSLWKMLDRLIGDDIELDAKFSDDVARVKVDAGQYEQVLINLAVNARDAMPDGGHLLIETRNITLDDSYREMYPEVIPGHYVETSVSDTGVGMSKELIERIFEPFFTTKNVGKGTGLGLATVFGIVKQSGGHITVYSELGEGSTFKIYLPALPVDTASEPSSAMHVSDMPHGSETILLVEDAPAVRALLRDSLEECGYKVYEAQDGREALDLAAELGDKIALMVSDEVMPRLRGHELAAQVRQLIPSCEILLVSGYTEETVLKQGILDANLAFLQKPFTPSKLAKKVRELLDNDSTNGHRN